MNEEIDNIFKNNELSDLKTFIIQRDNLNKTNVIFLYSYHIINTSAIIITTIATYYNYKPVLICGITINIFGQLLNTIVHLNNSISELFQPDSELYGLVEFKGKIYKIDCDKSLETLYKDYQAEKNVITLN